MRKSFYIFRYMLISLLLILYVILGFYYCKIPDKFYLTKNENLKINSFFDIKSFSRDSTVIAAASIQDNSAVELVSLKLFGLIPIKNVEVEKIERPLLIPCGTPFGIKMLASGAVVTGFGNVDGINKNCSPAKDSGILCGDIIKKVNNIEITKNSDITQAVQINKYQTQITLERNGKTMNLSFKPEVSKQDGNAKIGLWVRDSSAGIGTVTFYNSENNTFAGLGHGVCDIDTGKLLPLSSGEAVSVSISNVIKGFPGSPGELSGTFLSRIPIGVITSNTSAGVFGTANFTMTTDKALPMAFKQEVKLGKASILTTVSGNIPKEYDIIIEKIDYNEQNQVKNMVIKIIDPKLLNFTGGIVQGMSGSPIIQNGMLAGAITHVFVNDSKRGYAIFAENMYRSSDKGAEQIPLNSAA